MIWSEEHGAWWKPGEFGYITSLARAGLYSEVRAREIAANANRYCRAGEWQELAMPDPMWRRL